MSSIIATPIPSRGFVLIQVDVSDIPRDCVTIAREDVHGTLTYVRPNTHTDSDGFCTALSGGVGIVYDTEMELNTPYIYHVGDYDPDAEFPLGPFGSIADTGLVEVTVSADTFWLKDPIRPFHDQPLVFAPIGPDCVPGSAIFFQAMEVESYSSRTPRFVVYNRRNIETAPRVASGTSSTLTLVTRTFVDRDNVLALTAPGSPLFIQAPDEYGIPDHYIDVSSTSVSRLSPDHRKPWRVVALAHEETDPPAGLAYGVLGVRWVDMCDPYETFGDAEAAGVTWEQVLLGMVTVPPIPAGFRTYAVVDAEFADYAAVASGGRTYLELLEGD